MVKDSVGDLPVGFGELPDVDGLFLVVSCVLY